MENRNEVEFFRTCLEKGIRSAEKYVAEGRLWDAYEGEEGKQYLSLPSMLHAGIDDPRTFFEPTVEEWVLEVAKRKFREVLVAKTGISHNHATWMFYQVAEKLQRERGEREKVEEGVICGYCCNHCPDRDCDGREESCRREHAEGYCAAPEYEPVQR